MHYQKYLIPALFLLLMASCNEDDHDYDATGNFEAIERIISAEAMGTILDLDIAEGDILASGDTIGRIDVTHLQLQAEQIRATMSALEERTSSAGPQVAILTAQQEAQRRQVASLERQMEITDKEVARFTNLVNAEAAPGKQLDDLTGQRAVLVEKLNAARQQINVIGEQIAATRYQVGVQNRSVLSESTPTAKRLALVEKQISDGIIVNDYPGTIINQYAYDGEFATVGKPLYQIADLSELILRVYVSGDQLGQVKLQDTVTVRTDDGSGGYRTTDGVITWISSKAEFTPKTIQTKEERANRVYAVKIRVLNDGSYKIGMYAQIKFRSDGA